MSVDNLARSVGAAINLSIFPFNEGSKVVYTSWELTMEEFNEFSNCLLNFICYKTARIMEKHEYAKREIAGEKEVMIDVRGEKFHVYSAEGLRRIYIQKIVKSLFL